MKINSVLLVDDDVTNNFISQRVLENIGLFNKVTIAKNGKEALEYLSNHCVLPPDNNCPDIIFLDLNMPVVDGFSFLKSLQNYATADHGFRIFILTSSENPKDFEQVKKYNIEGYISKPLSEEKVMEIIH